MASRLSLHEDLKALLGSNNVYYQPPESLKIKYPCFIYRLSGATANPADNDIYLYTRQYQLTYITKDPDSELIDEIPKYFTKRLKGCRMSAHFTSDNLNHYNYTIHY